MKKIICLLGILLMLCTVVSAVDYKLTVKINDKEIEPIPLTDYDQQKLVAVFGHKCRVFVSDSLLAEWLYYELV